MQNGLMERAVASARFLTWVMVRTVVPSTHGGNAGERASTTMMSAVLDRLFRDAHRKSRRSKQPDTFDTLGRDLYRK